MKYGDWNHNDQKIDNLKIYKKIRYNKVWWMNIMFKKIEFFENI